MNRSEDALKALARYEELVGLLYGNYAREFREYEQFWVKMAAEESRHAEWICKLLRRTRDGSGFVKPGALDVADLKRAAAEVEKILTCSGPAESTHREALETALDIEKMMRKNRVHEVFEGRTPEILQVLYFLESAMDTHVRRIEELLESNTE